MEKKLRAITVRDRPRFKAYTRFSPEEFAAYLSEYFEDHKHTLGGYVNTQFSVIRLRKDKEKYWAPQLQIRIEQDEDDPQYRIVRGLFGPKPSVWTFFMFVYGVSIATILTTGIYGAVSLILGIESFWIWTVPISFITIILVYIFAKIGRRIAKEHMEVLYDFVELSIGNKNYFSLKKRD